MGSALLGSHTPSHNDNEWHEEANREDEGDEWKWMAGRLGCSRHGTFSILHGWKKNWKQICDSEQTINSYLGGAPNNSLKPKTYILFQLYYKDKSQALQPQVQ